MAFDPPMIAQAIEVIVRHRPGVTEREIAEAIFGENAYQQRVNTDCRLLADLGYIRREGDRPFRYFPGRAGPGQSQISN